MNGEETKQELLKSLGWDGVIPNDEHIHIPYRVVSDAMDDYASTQSEAFGKWISKSGYAPNRQEIWIRIPDFTNRKTTSELYDLFLEWQSKQQQ